MLKALFPQSKSQTEKGGGLLQIFKTLNCQPVWNYIDVSSPRHGAFVQGRALEHI